MDKVRVLRILEYSGDREWVENQMKNGSVPMVGQRQFSGKIDGIKRIIKSTVIDQFPEVFEAMVEKDEVVDNCLSCKSSDGILERCILGNDKEMDCLSDNYCHYIKRIHNSII